MRDALAGLVALFILCAVVDPQWVGEWSAKVYKAFVVEMME